MNAPSRPATIAEDPSALTIRVRELEQEVEELRQQLDDRKLVERAKGVVMRMLQVDEEDAFFRLRKHASNRNRKLADVAREVIKAEEPFRELRGPR
jgi:response regulator NasT